MGSIVTSFMMVSMVWSGQSAVVDGHPQFRKKIVVDDTVQPQPEEQQQNRNLPQHSTHVDIVKLINNKYKYGRPSNILGENGILIHMASRLHSLWGSEGEVIDDGFSHLACSIINTHNPEVFPQGNGFFQFEEDMPPSHVGYILEDGNTPIQCAFPEDAGTDLAAMKDSEWSGCACLGDNPVDLLNVSTCMMPSDQLKEVMELSSTEHGGIYNEVIVPKQYWNEAIPSGRAILAFFYVKDSPHRESVVASHKNYLSYTLRNSSQTPLLEYDATNRQQPFIEQ
mmetsp:Transcript_34413/g.83249  ORF Transcript_34413/g.83249 Transcript_34413/m.83249 type:complete len:282 (-) Transcript_34413:110-955(-)